MDQKDLEYFKELMLNKRQKLLAEMADAKETQLETTNREASGDHSGYSFHMADQGTDSMNREILFMHAQRDCRELYLIEDALERIGNRSFGICESCSGDIGTARLEALPEARLCIQCQSKEENFSSVSYSGAEF